VQVQTLNNIQGNLFTQQNGNYVDFLVFHSTYPKVYMLFEKYALQLIAAGHTKLGAKMIIERIRWEFATGSKDADGFKINNNHTCFYSRLFITNHPQYKDFFEFRKVNY